MARFDVILPTVCRPALRRAVLSVCDQREKDWRLWVVSDGIHYSKDMDLPYDPRISYLYLPSKHNDSGATPRNTGIEFGDSKYIAYLDDDDYWLPHHLEVHSKLLGEANMSRTAGQPFRMKRAHRLTKRWEEKVGPINNSDILTVGMVHSRELFNSTKGWSTENVDSHDRELWNEMLKLGGTESKSEEVTFRFLR